MLGLLSGLGVRVANMEDIAICKFVAPMPAATYYASHWLKATCG